jgi:hypothetical protein
MEIKYGQRATHQVHDQLHGTVSCDRHISQSIELQEEVAKAVAEQSR